MIKCQGYRKMFQLFRALVYSGSRRLKRADLRNKHDILRKQKLREIKISRREMSPPFVVIHPIDDSDCDESYISDDEDVDLYSKMIGSVDSGYLSLSS